MLYVLWQFFRCSSASRVEPLRKRCGYVAVQANGSLLPTADSALLSPRVYRPIRSSVTQEASESEAHSCLICLFS